MRGLAPPLPPLSLLLPGVLLGSLMSSFLGKAVLLRVARTLTPSTDERHNIGSSNGLGLCKGTVNVGLLSPEGSFQLVHGDGVKEGDGRDKGGVFWAQHPDGSHALNVLHQTVNGVVFGRPESFELLQTA